MSVVCQKTVLFYGFMISDNHSIPGRVSQVAVFQQGDLMCSDDIKRLSWQCRRGMLETDIPLQRFLKEGYAALDASDRAVFKRLLQEDDPQLYAWFIGESVPASPDFQRLIQLIRTQG